MLNLNKENIHLERQKIAEFPKREEIDILIKCNPSNLYHALCMLSADKANKSSKGFSGKHEDKKLDYNVPALQTYNFLMISVQI
jgi:hypothetical protein